MSLSNFDLSSADIKIFVSFQMQPINAVYATSLRNYLFTHVVFPRRQVDETVTAGEFYKKNESVVSVISYQFGDLYNIEYECEDVAEELQEKIEEWIEEMGGYDIVKPKASALTESS